jgi:hypothetical protein
MWGIYNWSRRILSKESPTHTEKVSNNTWRCRLWDVKNSGYKNSSPTGVKRTFIHQNLSIFITKKLWNFCQTKNSPQNQHTYILVLELFISNLYSFHFHYVTIILHLSAATPRRVTDGIVFSLLIVLWYNKSKTWKLATKIYFFANETNTFHISYVESKNC